MNEKTTQRIVSSKIARAAMSVILALGMLTCVPGKALAAESVEVSIGGSVPYAGYTTNYMWADGNAAYCAQPAAPTPEPGTYSKSGVSDRDLIAAMWFSYGAPGFDSRILPSDWYDGGS